jgi:hypothetical protein
MASRAVYGTCLKQGIFILVKGVGSCKHCEADDNQVVCPHTLVSEDAWWEEDCRDTHEQHLREMKP